MGYADSWSSNDYLFSLLEVFLFFFPLILPPLILPIRWMYKKKIALSVEISGSDILLEIKKRKFELFDKNDVAYSLHHHYNYSVMIFYQKHKIGNKFRYKPICDIIAHDYVPGWKIETLNNIHHELQNQGFKRHTKPNNKLLIFRLVKN